jgi:5-methylcytosine-specific restriction endonuclease McrA
MSTTHIPAALRRAVLSAAQDRCEYCLIHEDDTFFGMEIDHIVAEKHGGVTIFENLCCACLTCNRFKGSDIATIDLETEDVVRLFHPRRNRWAEHFVLKGSRIMGLTEIGKATARLLKLNLEERVLERELLQSLERYPTQ